MALVAWCGQPRLWVHPLGPLWPDWGFQGTPDPLCSSVSSSRAEEPLAGLLDLEEEERWPIDWLSQESRRAEHACFLQDLSQAAVTEQSWDRQLL